MRDTVDRGNDRVMKMTGWGREIKTTPWSGGQECAPRQRLGDGESRQRLDRTVWNMLQDNASETGSRDNASTGRSGICSKTTPWRRWVETTPRPDGLGYAPRQRLGDGESRQRLDRTVRNVLQDNASETVSRDNASTGRSGIRVLETTPLADGSLSKQRLKLEERESSRLPLIYSPYVPSGVGVWCELVCSAGVRAAGVVSLVIVYFVPRSGLLYMWNASAFLTIYN